MIRELDLPSLIAHLRARRGDSTTLEIKAAAGGCPELGDTLCAFANMPEGGTIILGLDEEAGFTPVRLPDIATLEQGVAAQARNAVIPPAQCHFETVQLEGHDLLICHIDALPLQDRPARFGGRAYLRQSDGDYPMSAQEIAQIELQKTQATRRTHPDRDPVPGTSTADLDPGLVDRFVTAARAASSRHGSVDDAEVLRRLNVTSRHGALTLAGLYALGNYPQREQPTLGVTAAVQLPRGSGHRTRDLVHLDGPIPDLLDAAMDWVRRNTRTEMGYDDRGHGVDVTELPMRAVREIIANALVHRNLDAVTDSKRVEIRLTDDRLVITSPGGLWGVTEQQLGKPEGKSAVNQTLYDICKHLRMNDGSRIIEGEGGGIREALEALRDAGLRPPEFIDSGVRFTVLISRHTLIDDAAMAWLATLPTPTPLSSEQRAILVDMRGGGRWTNARVRETFPPTDSVEARRMLQQLVDLGLAETEGERGARSYLLQARLTPEEDRAEPTDGRPADRVWAALQRPQTIRGIADATGLTARQVRYALHGLRESGRVVLDGAQGVRTSTYRRVDQA